MKIKLFYLPLVIILAGVLFSFYLQWQIPDGVFFSGDAGLKALLAQQLSTGNFRFDLVPPLETWVRNLWDNSLYAYQEPFVYKIANHYYITFPFTFPLVTAPFYALFGYRGLYIIPVVSTWAIWITFYFACRGLKLNTLSTSLGLFILIFGSPLTIYSAMYWEHTLAVALAFVGITLLFIYEDSSGLSRKNALLSGIFIGLSVWFRPEFLCLALILILWVYIADLSQLTKLTPISNKLQLNQLFFGSKNKIFFAISTLLTIGLFILCNQLIYNHPLGIHAIQVVEKVSLSQKIRDIGNNFRGMSLVFLQFFPITYFAVLYPILSLVKRRQIKFDIRIAAVYVICLLFIIGVSIIVPPGTAGLIPGGKQWGTRFLLILIPIISLLIIKELTYLKEATNSLLRYIGIFIVSVLLIFSLHKNTCAAIAYLHKTHQGILPAIEFLNQNPNQIIAISNQFVAQVLQASVPRDKLFFLIEDEQELVQLSTELVVQNQPKFTYICYPYRPCELPEQKSDDLKFIQDNQKFIIKFLPQGKFGNYPFYEVSIVRQ